ncbi:DUF2961 domain-containing protein [Olivibacter sp. SDN3]|uniref:glycoside hydrolase family 172 protein n=1 Tax=Olivibacter sp. SDN3 TaxID=2764720 RepID=UPI001650FAC7|nr:glycoside hydrolase family 172 protein [Olivibacter sp. SDN3]QNL51735.1 DUF2961 domain-containing protein [Olivibacter sp. SDN3]
MKALFSVMFLYLIAYSFSWARQSYPFDGLQLNMGNIYRLSDAKTRSITPENFTGGKGDGAKATLADSVHRNRANNAPSAKHLGQGWKLNPYIKIESGETFTIADMEGPGAIQHIWMTATGNWRFSILRIYWDGEEAPSVECPLGDFFGMGWSQYAHLNSIPVTVNPGSAFNCYWPMPFRKKCRVTVENIATEQMVLFYQIDYTLTEVPTDAAYFHAQFQRSNPTEKALHTIVTDIKGKGHYVGTYIAWGTNNKGWWGEGEVKFYLDGDSAFPTISGTGTEDYFGGSYCFEVEGQYVPFSTAYAGLHQVIKPDGVYQSQQRFGMYRWHIMDPIRFDKDLKVTIQDLGLKNDLMYRTQQSDISSVAFWYQTEPHHPFSTLPTKDELEIN